MKRKFDVIFALSVTAIIAFNIVNGYILLHFDRLTTQEDRFTNIGTLVFNVLLSVIVGVCALGYLKRGE